jgi:hypothetical protein
MVPYNEVYPTDPVNVIFAYVVEIKVQADTVTLAVQVGVEVFLKLTPLGRVIIK